MLHEPKDGWARLDGLRLHYWVWPGAEPTLLCMHGITANSRYWDTLAERLAGRHRLIAVDFRGRGLSDKPPPGSYGWDRHAADMAAALRALGTGPVIAVGHSLGGYIATLLAANEPALVSRLVVVDAAIGLDEASVRAQIGAALKRLELVFPSREAYLDYWQQVPYIPWTPAFERYVRADMDERTDGTVVSRALPAAVEEDLLFYFRPGGAEWFADAARRVRAPTVVCWAPGGLADPQQPLMSRQGINALASLIPGARVLPIDGTNHYTILLAPDAVDRIIGALDASPSGARTGTVASEDRSH
jgi:pimeloyl-ACP methyl ester carboxylesterase